MINADNAPIETVELVGSVSPLGIKADYAYCSSAYDAAYHASIPMATPANVKYTFDKATGNCIAVELIK